MGEGMMQPRFDGKKKLPSERWYQGGKIVFFITDISNYMFCVTPHIKEEI